MSQPEAPTWTVSDPEFQADSVVPLNPVYPWAGHRNFGYDLVRWMQPARVVELGVHWGTSFFAFAQAIKDARLTTELIGVDTFKGEEHSGLYGEEVYKAVSLVIDRYFRNQPIVLHRMFFTDALERVADASADLIHIDGLHTHEAARFDFESWLPKLAPEGAMLFHDTALSTGYGSANFWREVAASHPSFAFEHSWGLGVLFPKGDTRLRALRHQGLADKIPLYTFKAECRLGEIKIRDLTKMADQRYANIQEQARLIDQRTRDLEMLQQRIADRDAWLADLRHSAGDAEALRNKLRAAEKMCIERYEAIQRLSADLHQARARIAQLDSTLNEAQAAVQRRVAEAQSLERQLKDQRGANDQLNAALQTIRTDVELLTLRAEHVEAVVSDQRARLDALMQTRAGRRIAARLPVTMRVPPTNGAAR